MPDSFFKTADRMYDSSKTLHQAEQFHNACYLAGYVVECYMKLIVDNISALGIPRSYSHRIKDMNRDLQYAITSAATVSAYAPYLIDLSVSCHNIFSSWTPNDRYTEPSAWNNASVSQQFQQEMEKCFEKIFELYDSGLIH